MTSIEHDALRFGQALRPVDNGAAFIGESLSFPERLLVAPAHGVVHRRRVRIGRHLEPGVVLVDLRSDGTTIRLGSPVAGTFVTWVVDEGERVHQGRVLARILPDGPPASA